MRLSDENNFFPFYSTTIKNSQIETTTENFIKAKAEF